MSKKPNNTNSNDNINDNSIDKDKSNLKHALDKEVLTKNFKSLALIVAILAYFMLFFYGMAPAIKSGLSYLKVNEHLSMINALLLVTSLVYIIGMLVPYVIYKIAFRFKVMCNINFKDSENKKLLLNNFVISLLIGICVQPLGMGISGLSSLIAGSNTVTDAISKIDNVNYVLIAAFIYAIFPGILEELVFRGVIFQTAQKYFKLSHAAIISGICFGIMHMNLQQFVYAAILGTFFAYIYEKTKNILDVILVHFMIDFSQFALALSVLNITNDNLEYSASPVQAQTPVSISIFVLFCFILIIPFASICHSLYENYKTPNTDSYNKSNSSNINNDSKATTDNNVN